MRRFVRRLICRVLGHVAPRALDPLLPTGWTTYGNYVGDKPRRVCGFCDEREHLWTDEEWAAAIEKRDREEANA